MSGMHSGGRIPPASLKRAYASKELSDSLALRGENPPGLIEAT